MVEHEDIPKPALSAARLAANGNAQKSTGPKTEAGERRVALNARRRGLAPPEIEQQLRAHGEDPALLTIACCRLKDGQCATAGFRDSEFGVRGA